MILIKAAVRHRLALTNRHEGFVRIGGKPWQIPRRLLARRDAGPGCMGPIDHLYWAPNISATKGPC